MLSRDFKALIAPRARALFVIWGAIMLAPLMYVVVAWFLFGQTEGQGMGAETDLPWTQIGMGLLVLLGIAATYYQRVALGSGRLKAIVEAPPVAPGGKDQDLFEKLPSAEQRLLNLWQHYQTTMIVVWAILEAIAVVGLVLTILQRDFRVIIPFALAAIILMVLKRPRPAEFMEGIRM